MGFEQVTITATIAATPWTTWRAWTEPAHITRWNFAAPDWHCPHAEVDLRPGGRYRARMEAKDGSFGFDLEAVFDIVEPERRISFIMPDGRRAETTFEAIGGGTRVTTTFDAETENPIEMQRAGWQAILDNFARYAAAL